MKKNKQIVLTIVIVFLSILIFCRGHYKSNYDSFRLYRNEVNYRMVTTQRSLTTIYSYLVTDKGSYDPSGIVTQVNKFLEKIDIEGRNGNKFSLLREELPRFWKNLSVLSEGLPPEQWKKANFDRFFIVNGFELLPRNMERRLTDALLEINNTKNRKHLYNLWFEIDKDLFNNLEQPIYEFTDNYQPKSKMQFSSLKNLNGSSEYPLILAHRGGYSEFPENSLAAFRYAYMHGSDGIECDVRLSSDGEVFVLHDNSLDRLTGIREEVRNVTSNELLSMKLLDPLNSRKTSESPLRLEDLLKEFGGKMILWIELKSDGGEDLPRKVGDLLQKYKLVRQVIVSSFSSQMLSPLRNRFPKIKVAYEFSVLKDAEILPLMTSSDRERIIVSADHLEQFTPQLLRKLIRAEIQTSSYTVNRYDALHIAMKQRIKFIQTDRPDRAIFMRELLWPQIPKNLGKSFSES